MHFAPDLTDVCLTCPRATGDVLDILEQRHDWAKFVFTLELFKYVFFNLIPDVLFHERKQDEEQVRDTYDRMSYFPTRVTVR